MTFKPTRQAGLDRLKEFVPRAGHAYAAKRNFDFGPGAHHSVSTLSPWLRHRLLLEDEVISVVLRQHGPDHAEKFIQEVFWRGYFKGYLEHRPEIWHRYLADLAKLPDTKDLKRAWDGRTSIENFDHWVGELIDTGYLHNHARMWFASIWIFTLKLPWQQGADFFMRHLLDGDPASNTLSWRWVAGLHTKGKTYLARPDNIERYTEGRFERDRTLASDAPALIEDDPVPAAKRPSPKLRSLDAATALILDDDTMPDLSWFETHIKRTIGINLAENRSPNAITARPKAFTQGAIEAAIADNIDPIQAHSLDELIAILKSASDPIITADATTGPASILLDRLEAEGLDIVRRQRRFDRLLWPHTKAGFFKLKAKIPLIINELEQSA